MSAFPQIVLRRNKTDAVKRFHPWIFSGAIKQADGQFKDGDIVEVYSETGEYLATGHYSPGSIAVRIFSFAKITDFKQLLLDRFKQAFWVRQQAGLVNQLDTNCYRLINGEGDCLPGLVIDWYNGTAVLQAHAIGMHLQHPAIVETLQLLYGDALKAVYDKSLTMLTKRSQSESQDGYLFGSKLSDEILEYQHRFVVDWEAGQKTGFFLDQRENRHLLAQYATDKKVLNTFCYSGGFSVYAVKAKARLVHSVDSSVRAIELTEHNIALNNASEVPHESFVSDVFDFLKHCDADYDLIVLDPPAFAKNLSARHQAMQAYRRLNEQAFSKVKTGGIVFTFSCSQAVIPEYFHGAVTAAAIASGRNIRILHHLGQPADHPISIFHPEGLYLKGLVLLVE